MWFKDKPADSSLQFDEENYAMDKPRCARHIFPALPAMQTVAPTA